MGHDFGGACISYAMEMFPSKISKAVFVAGTMLVNGQSALDVFSPQVYSCCLCISCSSKQYEVASLRYDMSLRENPTDLIYSTAVFYLIHIQANLL